MSEFLNSLEPSPSKKESHHLVTEYQKKFIDGSQFYELNLMKSHWDSGEVLSSTLSEGSKGILKIQVLDSGCGMTLKDQAKLFQKFSQVSPVQGQRKIDTGLGLWICKELANRLDSLHGRSWLSFRTQNSSKSLSCSQKASQTPTFAYYSSQRGKFTHENILRSKISIKYAQSFSR